MLAQRSMGNLGCRLNSKQEFERAKDEEASRRTLDAGEKRELKDNYLYVTRNEHRYRETLMKRTRKSTDIFEPY